MKRLSFILICLLSAAGVADAQTPTAVKTVSYSGREYYKYSGKEYAKIWTQADPGNLKSRSERVDEQTGEKSIIIFRQDSAKMFVLKPEKKTYMVLAMSQLNLNDLVGLNLEKDRNVQKELVGIENINGYECHHYKFISNSTFNNGTQEKGCHESWIFEPLNVTMQQSNCGYDEPITLGSFQQGQQSAHLFEIPKDYNVIALPTGGLMELITGNSRQQNQKDVDDAKQTLQSTGEKLQEIGKNPDPNQQIQGLLNLLNEGGKK